MLKQLDNELQTWPISTTQQAIKCLVLKFTEQQQKVEDAKYLVIPLLHQKPPRVGPYWKDADDDAAQ